MWGIQTFRAFPVFSPIICPKSYFNVFVFTALHEMQTRSSDENYVCPSVRLFVCLSDA